ncbi:alpha/beta-hydrolase [Trametes meyenii]|nr:alpha/beta-hydrolase [Trametes meyenii]
MLRITLVSVLTLLGLSDFARGASVEENAQTYKGGNRTRKVEWGPCDPSLVKDPTLECSLFEIPLDYHDAYAGHGRLALVKANATGERHGTVFVNPGGPGQSGLEALDGISDELLALTGGHYDVVSWDPRGVGPLTVPGDTFCFDTVAEYDAFWNGTIELTGINMVGNFTHQADIDALLSQASLMQAKYEELGRRCLEHPSGQFLRYVGTAATARDVAALADALDGPGSPINYIGISYGTILGSWLVNMFPERVGRVVIDGVIDPTFLANEETPFVWPRLISDADKVYEGFVTGCALAGPEGCPIASQGDSATDVDDTIQALLQLAHDAQLKNSSVSVRSTDVRVSILAVLYQPGLAASFANTTFPELLAAVKSGLPANATTSAVSALRVNMTAPADTSSLIRRGRARNTMNPTTTYRFESILCSDSVDSRGTRMEDVFKNIIASSSSANGSELFTAVWPAQFYYCPFWPVRAVERYQGPFNKTLVNKVLIVSNTFDPVTPLFSAESTSRLLGDNAVLVRQDAFGHTSISEPSQCLNQITLAYFTNGSLPEDNNTVCEVDADFELFPGVNTEAILAALPT